MARPLKAVPLTHSVVTSLGIEKVGKDYAVFIMKTSGDKVVEKKMFQPDIRMCAQMTFQEQYDLHFFLNEKF